MNKPVCETIHTIKYNDGTRHEVERVNQDQISITFIGATGEIVIKHRIEVDAVDAIIEALQAAMHD